MTPIVFRIAAALLLFASQSLAESPPRIAIIIDDLGYQLDAGRRAIDLPGPVACAILPGTPRARQLAKVAHDHGKEVLLHLPLQAIEQQGRPDPGGITLDMSRARFAAVFAAAIESVPFAAGVNSHRGSLLTRHPGHMRWLMEDIHARDGLFFIDSYTTHASVALRVAAETGVAALKRDVFLDADPAPEAIQRELERLKAIASQRGHAVAIAHPYTATLEILERELPRLRAAGFELVPISALINGLDSLQREGQRAAAAEDPAGHQPEATSAPVTSSADAAAARNAMNRSEQRDSKTTGTARGT
jgi:polysaccharide deacetylase 2 family uncharacterized protein YibQ